MNIDDKGFYLLLFKTINPANTDSYQCSIFVKI